MTADGATGKVVVTYGRSLIALMIAQSLGSRGISVVGCDDVPLTVLSFSKFVESNHVYTSPDKDEERFIHDLLNIVNENRPGGDGAYILMPAFRESKIIAKHKDRFDGLITVGCPQFEAIDKVDPKDHFARTLKDLDIESPRTWLPEDSAELDELLSEIPFPVFIKPPDDVGGRGISKVESKTELSSSFEALSEKYPDQQILIQEPAEGVDYCYCGLFDRGSRVASMVYHNLRKFPLDTGPGVVRETVVSEKFDVLADKLMKPLEWHGVVEIDFMWDEAEESTPKMLEVNPRFWAGLDHSIKSDVDFPWLVYRLFVDGHVDSDAQAKIGHKTELPVLSTLARIEGLVSDAIDFEKLDERWPELEQHIQNQRFAEAVKLLTSLLSNSVSLGQVYESFKAMLTQPDEAESISYTKDDPLVGLGVLFVLGSLIKHAELPPELTR